MSKNEPRITVDGKTAPCPECRISGDHKMSCSRGGSKGARFTMRMEHAADAVTMLQRMHACVVLSENHGDVPRVSSDEVLAVLRAIQAERVQHAEEVARLEERCHAREEQLGKLTELYDAAQARLEAFEEQEPDARTCAEWAATVALKSSDVHSAARRYLCGEQRGIVAQVHRENDSLRAQLRKVEGERDGYRERLQIDPGGSDIVDELTDAASHLRHALGQAAEFDADTQEE